MAKFDSTWTCPQNLEGVEWAFHYGGAGANQPTPCTQSGDEIWFDNMSIEDTTGSEGDWKGGQDNLSALGVMNRDNSGLENNYISVNQVGYFTKLANVATLGDNKGDKIHGLHQLSLATRLWNLILLIMLLESQYIQVKQFRAVWMLIPETTYILLISLILQQQVSIISSAAIM